jgi:hypothetical protein
MDSGEIVEIVIDRMDRHHCNVVFDLLGKAVGQAREATPIRIVRLWRSTLRRSHMSWIGVAAQGFHFAPDTSCRGISGVKF